jgi:hypothetical protein
LAAKTHQILGDESSLTLRAAPKMATDEFWIINASRARSGGQNWGAFGALKRDPSLDFPRFFYLAHVSHSRILY